MWKPKGYLKKILEMCLGLLFKCYLWIDAHSIDTRGRGPSSATNVDINLSKTKANELVRPSKAEEGAITYNFSFINPFMRARRSLSFPRLLICVESPPTLKLSSTQGKLHGESRRLYNERGRENYFVLSVRSGGIGIHRPFPRQRLGISTLASQYIYIFDVMNYVSPKCHLLIVS